jgi:hypothetical protein
MAEGSIRGIVCNGISDGNRPGHAAELQRSGPFAARGVKACQADECPACGAGVWDGLVQRKSLLISGPGGVVVRAFQGDIVQAYDGVALAPRAASPAELSRWQPAPRNEPIFSRDAQQLAQPGAIRA